MFHQRFLAVRLVDELAGRPCIHLVIMIQDLHLIRSVNMYIALFDTHTQA